MVGTSLREPCFMILGGLGTILVVKWLTHRLMLTIRRAKLRDVVNAKYDERAKNVDLIRKQLDGQSEVEDQVVLSLPTKDLLLQLRNGSIRPIQVLRAMQRRALRAQEKLNCVTMFFPEAQQWALDLEQLEEKERGPLFGLPMSIKECYSVKGYDSTAGMALLLNDPAKDHCLAVKQLLKMGAVPFCHTNVPQTMMSLETNNPAYGATGNPHDPSREPGGSSGGEGSLIGGGGSIAGIGSDFAGSLRSPAVLCGICSLRPTFGRHLSQSGVRSALSFDPIYPDVVGGYMARDMDTLVTLHRSSYNDPIILDPFVVPLTWNEEKFQCHKPLVVGYYVKDNVWEPHPGIPRAVRLAVDALEKQGHSIKEIDPPPVAELCKILTGLTFTDYGRDMYNVIEPDLPNSSNRTTMLGLWLMTTLPVCLFRLLSRAVKLVTNLPLSVPFYTGLTCSEAVHRKRKLMIEYQKYLDDQGVDVIVCPSAFSPAPKKGTLGDLTLVSTMSYSPWNVLDVPAGIVPVSSVTKDDDAKLEKLPKNDLVYHLMKSSVRGGVGMPLAVQVVGRRFQEEMVLKTMTLLEKAGLGCHRVEN